MADKLRKLLFSIKPPGVAQLGHLQDGSYILLKVKKPIRGTDGHRKLAVDFRDEESQHSQRY